MFDLTRAMTDAADRATAGREPLGPDALLPRIHRRRAALLGGRTVLGAVAVGAVTLVATQLGPLDGSPQPPAGSGPHALATCGEPVPVGDGRSDATLLLTPSGTLDALDLGATLVASGSSVTLTTPIGIEVWLARDGRVVATGTWEEPLVGQSAAADWVYVQYAAGAMVDLDAAAAVRTCPGASADGELELAGVLTDSSGVRAVAGSFPVVVNDGTLRDDGGEVRREMHAAMAAQVAARQALEQALRTWARDARSSAATAFPACGSLVPEPTDGPVTLSLPPTASPAWGGVGTAEATLRATDPTVATVQAERGLLVVTLNGVVVAVSDANGPVAPVDGPLPPDGAALALRSSTMACETAPGAGQTLPLIDLQAVAVDDVLVTFDDGTSRTVTVVSPAVELALP